MIVDSGGVLVNYLQAIEISSSWMVNIFCYVTAAEFLDIVFFYKAVNNLVFIDSEALPATRQSTRSTRSSSSNAITYIPKRCRTVTYQRSFFIRACRTRNVLPAELRTSYISLASFKRSLLQYYNEALDLYDVDDIRTWRTICPRCNIARTLLCPPTCCF